MNSPLCCVLNLVITCDACAKPYCRQHYGYTPSESINLRKCANECFDQKSICATQDHEWHVYDTVFYTCKRTCMRNCGITDQHQRIIKGNDYIPTRVVWIYL